MSKHIESSRIIPCPLPTSKRFINLTGKVFGRLTVRGFIGKCTFPNSPPACLWECLCECGKTYAVVTGSLIKGLTRSCGCLNREACLERFVTHNKSHSSEFRVWTSMLTRCRNPNCKEWKNYGGRGINVCLRWLSFESFFRDMGPRPSPRHSIDRIDNNGNYEPSNCRWATPTEQGRNKRSTRWITSRGLTLTMSEWCKRTGIKHTTFLMRLKLKWPMDVALYTPVRKR